MLLSESAFSSYRLKQQCLLSITLNYTYLGLNSLTHIHMVFSSDLDAVQQKNVLPPSKAAAPQSTPACLQPSRRVGCGDRYF